LARLGHILTHELALAVGAFSELDVGAEADALKDGAALGARDVAAGGVVLGLDVGAARAAQHHGWLVLWLCGLLLLACCFC
jgi:hypothetical protein